MKSIILVLCFSAVAFANFPGGFPDIDDGMPGLPDEEEILPPGVIGGQLCPRFGIFRMPDVNSCGGYIQCDNGLATPNNCSLGTHFSVHRGICMDREQADCDLCRFNRRSVWFHPKEGSCTQYHVCFGPDRETFTCAPGFQFNPRIRQCDHADNVNCVEDETETRLCPNTRRTTFLPSLLTCDAFLVCSNGGPSSYHTCAEGLRFDIETSRCSQTGRCIHDYKPECPDWEDQMSFHAHIYDCRHFYICEKGEARLQGCAPGLQFDIVARQCNKPDRATCAQPPRPNNNGRPTWPNL